MHQVFHDLTQYFNLTNNSKPKFSLIILNQPIVFNATFKSLFERAKVKVCADGGGNRLYDTIKENNTAKDGELREQYLPDCIVGDLDSLREEVQQFFQILGVPILKIEDQDSTDLFKAFDQIKSIERVKGFEPLPLIIYGGIGGRFDHTMATINSIFSIYNERQVLVYTPENCIIPLVNLSNSPIQHVIKMKSCLKFGRNCGVIPFSGPIKITTEGLKWDMVDQVTKFNGLVSSSNYVLEGQVKITLFPNSEESCAAVFTLEIDLH